MSKIFHLKFRKIILRFRCRFLNVHGSSRGHRKGDKGFNFTDEGRDEWGIWGKTVKYLNKQIINKETQITNKLTIFKEISCQLKRF